jgi:hypothetical protein
MLDALSAAERELAEEERRQRFASVRARVAYRTTRVSVWHTFGLQPRQEMGWEIGQGLSDAQKTALEKAGIDTRDLTRTQASQLLDEMGRRRDTKQCTYKQARLLAKYGYRTDIPFAKANEIIGAIAANDWRPIDPPAADAANPSADPALAAEPAITIY